MSPPAHAVVLSIDEKSQIQALDRSQPTMERQAKLRHVIKGETMDEPYPARVKRIEMMCDVERNCRGPSSTGVGCQFRYVHRPVSHVAVHLAD
jgi:hypothetical protein